MSNMSFSLRSMWSQAFMCLLVCSSLCKNISSKQKHNDTASSHQTSQASPKKSYTELSTYTEFLDCLNQGKYILVKFHANWCEGCTEVEPAFEYVCHTYAQYVIPVAIDLDNQYLYSKVQHYVDRGIPTIVLLDQNGKELTKQIGSSDAETLDRVIADQILPPKKRAQERKREDQEQQESADIPTITSYKDYQKVIANHANVAILIQADWCSPCKTFAKTFTEFSQKTPDVYCCQISINNIHEDASLQNELASYVKKQIPTTVFVLDGIPQTYITGSYPLNLVESTARRNLRISQQTTQSQQEHQTTTQATQQNAKQTESEASSGWFGFGKQKAKRKRRRRR